MEHQSPIVILPDAGPLITLAYAEGLDTLLKPGWPVQIVDMVLHELTRNQTPTSAAIGSWISKNNLKLLPTNIYQRYLASCAGGDTRSKKSNLGELALQEAMTRIAGKSPAAISVLLFEDHKIARTSFAVPENCRKISTRAFLTFLEQMGWLESAAAVERKAILNGRNFSQIRFPA